MANKKIVNILNFSFVEVGANGGEMRAIEVVYWLQQY